MIHKFSRYLLTLVALLAMTTGAWAQATFGVKEITPDMVPDSWNGDNSAVTADELAKWGFVEITEAEALTWTGVPQQGTVRLIYSISSGSKSLDWEGGVQDGSSYSFTHRVIYNLVCNPQYNSDFDVYITTEPSAPAAGEVTISDDQTEAEFDMPSYDATLEYQIVRNLASNMTAEIADRIRIKKDGTMFVAVDESQLVPTVKDVADAQNPVTLEADKDYTVTFQKKDGDTWVDVTLLSVGTFRLVITAKDDSNYGGELFTSEFQLFQGYEVTVPAGEYVTYYRTDDNLKLDDEPTGGKLYTITAVGDATATATEITSANSGMPFLVFNGNTETKTFLLIPTEDVTNQTFYAGFIGTVEPATIAASDASADRYALNGKQFVWVKNAIEVGANKAWLEVSNGANARALTIVFDETTKITTTNVTNLTNGDWYDLNGRKLNAMPTKKGVYIFNGRKVVVK